MDQNQLAAIGQWLKDLQGLERELRDLNDPARTAGAFSKALGDLSRQTGFDEESTTFLSYLQSLAPDDR